MPSTNRSIIQYFTVNLPKNFANDMFSRMDKSGTTKMPEPILDAMSTKLYVSLPTLLSNGGSLKLGRPDSTGSNSKKQLIQNIFNHFYTILFVLFIQ